MRLLKGVGVLSVVIFLQLALCVLISEIFEERRNAAPNVEIKINVVREMSPEQRSIQPTGTWQMDSPMPSHSPFRPALADSDHPYFSH